MNGKRLIPVLAIALLAQLGLNGGCRPELPADKEAVLRYLRAARINGEVRRLWPEGQAYVDAVLKADADLTKTYASLLAYADVRQLWSRDNPQWCDADAVQKKADELAVAAETGGVERMSARRALEDAIRKVPPGLNLTGDAKREFVEQVRGALAVDDLALRDFITQLENRAKALLIVYGTAAPHADTLVIEESRPRFSSAELQARFDRSYDTARDSLEAGLEHTLRCCEQEMIAYAKRIGGLEGAEQQYVRDRYKHYRDRATRLIRELRNERARAQKVEKAAEKRVRRASDDTRAAAEAALAFTKREVERLDGRITTLQQRVNDMLARAESIDAEVGGQD